MGEEGIGQKRRINFLSTTAPVPSTPPVGSIYAPSIYPIPNESLVMLRGYAKISVFR